MQLLRFLSLLFNPIPISLNLITASKLPVIKFSFNSCSNVFLALLPGSFISSKNGATSKYYSLILKNKSFAF